MMKTSILFEKQKTLGASFKDDGAWRLADNYSDLAEEYQKTDHVILLERPYLGHVKVSGKDHADLLHRITTNEIRNLQPGQGLINIFTNETGKIVDRVYLLRFDDSIYLINSRDNSEKICKWIDKFIFLEDVQVQDVSNTKGMISIFGKRAFEFTENTFNIGLPELPAFHFKRVNWFGFDILLHKTTELFLPGFNIITELQALPEIWDKLLEAGKTFGLTPIGEKTYHTLRIESGWPEFGLDFNETTNPHEAQMLLYVNFDKGCYIGQEVIARLDTYDKVQKYLVGIEVEGNVLPEYKSSVFSVDQEIGYTTSAAFSFHKNKSIVLGYIKTKFIKDGEPVAIISGNNKLNGLQAKLPFVKST